MNFPTTNNIWGQNLWSAFELPTNSRPLQPQLDLNHPEIDDELRSKIPFGQEPMHDKILHTAITLGRIEAVKYLIDQENPVSVKASVKGVTAFYQACKCNEFLIARMLYEKDRTVITDSNNLPYDNIQDEKTVLDLAKLYGPSELMSFLVTIKAPFDQMDQYGQTPLYWTINTRDEETALCLIENGARLDVKNKFGESLISLAVKKGCLKVVEKMWELKVNFNDSKPLLVTAAENDNLEVLQFLLSKLDSKNDLKESIVAAATSGNLENMKFLIQYEGDVKFKENTLNLLTSVKRALEESEKPLRNGSYRSRRPWESKQHREFIDKRDQLPLKLKAVITYLEELHITAVL